MTSRIRIVIHRPIHIFAVLAFAAVVSTCAFVVQPAAGAPSVKVPVVACPTSRGIAGQPPTKYAARLGVHAPPYIADQLSYYSDNVRNLTPVLGPRGWKCEVQVGADGSAGVWIYPPGRSAASKLAVSVQYVPACQGCMYALVCPLVPGSAKQVGESYGACPSRRPRREHIVWVTGSANAKGPVKDVVSFMDPAGVKGDGVPSGGHQPANGVLLYDWNKHIDAAALATCALPPKSHAICTYVLDDVITREWGMPR
jgi:hypothetical protein